MDRLLFLMQVWGQELGYEVVAKVQVQQNSDSGLLK